MIPGQGVSAAVEGHQVAAGNEALLTALDVPLSPQACQTAEQWRKEGCTIIYLALDGELAGALRCLTPCVPTPLKPLPRSMPPEWCLCC